MKRSLRRTALGLCFAPVIIAPLACSAPPPPPPKVAPKPTVVVAAPPPPPPLAPAHWMQAAGATVVGPRVGADTMVLVGGRRMLLNADGSVKAETAASPEPLQEVIAVPGPGGSQRLVARGAHGLFRLDDPLGAPKPLARSEAELRAIGGFSGLVAVWTQGSDIPRFVDIETGKFKIMTTLPHLPMRNVAFRNDKEGAAIFEGVGLAVTTDGGTSWKRVTEDVGGDALRVRNVYVREGSVRAFIYEDGPESPIDIAQARIGRAVDPPADEKLSGHPMMRWIRTTGVDPLTTAAAGGLELSDNVALIVNTGLMARVDTKTGAVTSIEEFATGGSSVPCSLQRAGKDAWLACPMPDDPDSDRYDMFGIMRVALDGASIKPDRASLTRSGEMEVRTSPSGGVMFMGTCSVDDSMGDVCVRQPDGRWITTGSEVELYMRAPGPLSDGRVAFLRNMWSGDVPESQQAGSEGEEDDRLDEESDPEGNADREEREIPERHRLYIAAVGENHKEERIATINWRARGDLRIQSPIQEDAEHNLHFIIADDEGVYAVVQPLDKEARTPQRLEGTMEARLRGARGIAVGAEGIRATTDGGRTWTGLPMPSRARESLSIVDSIAGDPTLFGVSEVGMVLERAVRIGWGTTDQFEDPGDPVFNETLPSVSRASGPERVLTCSVDAPTVQGTPPVSSSSQIIAALGKKTPAPKGTRRASVANTSSLGVSALFEEEGSDKPGTNPTKWTLSWHDGAELGGKIRTWSGAPPKDSTWGGSLRGVYGQTGRVVFHLRVGSKNILVRTKGAGVETAEVTYDLLPSNDLVFGSDKGEPIAWTHDNSIIVWIAGEQPRVVGQISYRTTRLLGEPTKDGIPVHLSSGDWSVMRTFPIPAADKKNPKPEPLAPTLDGWTPSPNIYNQIGRFPACSGKPAKGAVRFTVSRSYARGMVDNSGGSLNSSRYEVFVTGTEACVAQMFGNYSSDRRYSPPTPVAGAKPKGPIGFIRADFVGKRAEGGVRGLPAAKDAMTKLTCTLEERK